MKSTRTWLTALAGTVTALALTAGAHAQYGHKDPNTLYLFDGKRFYGYSVEVNQPVERLSFASFNDKAASIDFSGPGWLLCKDANFEGPCLVARKPIHDLDDFGLGDEISSVRPLSPRNPYPHGTIFGVNWAGDVVFYEADLFGNLSEMDPYDSWGYGYGDGYTMGAYGEYGQYGHYNPYNPYYDYDPNDWTGYRGPRNADVVLYRDSYFSGSAYGLNRDVWSLSNLYFNDEVSSIEVRRGRWEICTDSNFRGRCQILDASQSTLSGLQLNDNISSIRRLGGYRGGGKGGSGHHGGGYGGGHSGGYGGHNPHGGHQDGSELKSSVVLFEHRNYSGRYVGINGAIANLGTVGLNDTASSIHIRSGRWEICEHPNYQGRCQIVDASQNALNGLRLNDNISSIRPASQRQTQTYNPKAPQPYMGKTGGSDYTGYKSDDMGKHKDHTKTYGQPKPQDQTPPKPYVRPEQRPQFQEPVHKVTAQPEQKPPVKSDNRWTPQPQGQPKPPPKPQPQPQVQAQKPQTGKHAAYQNAVNKGKPETQAKPVVTPPPPKPVVKAPPSGQIRPEKSWEQPHRNGQQRPEVK